MTAPSPPEVTLLERRSWVSDDGRPRSFDRFLVSGGDVAEAWAVKIRIPNAPWCEITIWNDENRVSGFGGEVWPAAWPQLFVVQGPPGRQCTLLAPQAMALFEEARAAAACPG